MIRKSRKIRWGILGCGKIADKFASDLLLSKNAILEACASRDKAKSEAFAKKHHATLYFENYEELALCENIDVIYIATPNSFHLEHSILCLKNKKAVLCEKPLSINKLEAEQMIRVARENDVFLMEAMWTGFLPTIQKVQNSIQKGSIGEIIHLTADFGFKVEYNSKSRLFNSELGGGSLLDIGIYPLYISLLLMGKPNSVKSSIRYSESGVDASCSVLLSYPKGKTAALFSSFETITEVKCEIYGTEGKIIISPFFHGQKEYAIIKNGMEDELVSSEHVGFGCFYEIEHVNECLYQGLKESTIMTHEMSITLLELMDEIRS